MVIDDIISTIKEIHKRDGYAPVSLKVCNEDEKRVVYLFMVMNWMKDRLHEYRHKHGLEELK